MTFLIVEPDTDLAELLQEQLEEQGHSCLLAKDLEEAAWTLDIATVDAVALAFALSGPDPLDWLEELSLHRPGLVRRTVVVTSRRLDDAARMRIRACGATTLQRPFRAQELRVLMEQRVHATGDRATSDDARTPSRPRPRPEEASETDG